MEEIEQLLEECNIEYKQTTGRINVDEISIFSSGSSCPIYYKAALYRWNWSPQSLYTILFLQELINFIKTKGYNAICGHNITNKIYINLTDRNPTVIIEIKRHHNLICQTHGLNSREMMHMAILLNEIEKFTELSKAHNKMVQFNGRN